MRDADAFKDPRLPRANPVVVTTGGASATDRARREGTTRAAAGMAIHRDVVAGSIVAIGNAPTALWEVVRLIAEDGVRPALVIGVPVGFVQAAESKGALWQLQHQPAVTCLGRKGGSTVAVAALHALLELARDQRS